jgi:outer membrane lipopolysaccharide assembly protein LptE/RlpB
MILAKEEEEEVIIRGVRSTADSSLSLSLSTLFSFFLFSGEPSEPWMDMMSA